MSLFTDRFEVNTAADIRFRDVTDEELEQVFAETQTVIIAPPDNYSPQRSQFLGPVGHLGSNLTLPTPAEVVRTYTSHLPEAADSADTTAPGAASPGSLSLKQSKEVQLKALLRGMLQGPQQQTRRILATIVRDAHKFGARLLITQVFQFLSGCRVEEAQRHHLVRLLDRLLFRLGAAVRPMAREIIVIIQPMLVEDNYSTRADARELVRSMAKVLGHGTMITIMRDDIPHKDEYIRNTAALALAVITAAVGVAPLLPFLMAMRNSKKSWETRHTSVKIMQHMCAMHGRALLPHLEALSEIVVPLLRDIELKTQQQAALCVAALADCAKPHGYDKLKDAVPSIKKGVQNTRDKLLAAHLRALGSLIPLMPADVMVAETEPLMGTVIREYASRDDDIIFTCLRVTRHCIESPAINSAFILQHVWNHFIKYFWSPRTCADPRLSAEVAATIIAASVKLDRNKILQDIMPSLQDARDSMREMTMSVIHKLYGNDSRAIMIAKHPSSANRSRPIKMAPLAGLPAATIQNLVDGCMHAIQHVLCTSMEDGVVTNPVLDGFVTVCAALGDQLKDHLSVIVKTVRCRFVMHNVFLRKMNADLIARLAPIIVCHDPDYHNLNALNITLHEHIAEQTPEVLGAVLNAMKSIVKEVPVANVSPPVKDIVPQLIPLLKNKHEKVQQSLIGLLGVIADRAGDLIVAREWVRIAMDLLELLKAHRKSIRRATVNTFGYIAKAVGPHDVQERQQRLCSTIALAITAESCGPFTVIPAILNEYLTCDLNVRTGVLKTLSFMFEYIGPLGKDYLYASLPVLEDALTDRDQIHRQTAIFACKHIAIGCYGKDREDALIHLLNLVLPNMLESGGHFMLAFYDTLDAFGLSIGTGIVMQYIIQSMFHPAAAVRKVAWRIYNNLFVLNTASLVAHYPFVPDTNENTYQVHRMELLL